MSLSTLYFREVLWLFLSLLPVFLLLFNRWWQKRSLSSVADAYLIPWMTGTRSATSARLSIFSLVCGWILLCIALAGPRTVLQMPPRYQPEPAVLMLIVDLSASMQARDVRPDRRTRAQQLIKRWLVEKPSSLAIGIVLFSGHAFTLLPATTDDELIAHFTRTLQGIRLPTAGNDLQAAMLLAKQWLLNGQHQQRLWVLTDGDMELAEQTKVTELFDNELVNKNIQTLFVGIGESKPVTVPDTHHGLVMHEGRPVLSKIESGWLRQLSTTAGIDYQHHRQVQQASLEELLQLPVSRLSTDLQQQVVWQEWYSLPLLSGLIFLMLSVYLNSPTQKHRSSVGSAFPVIALLLLSLFLTPVDVLAQDKDLLERAQQALHQKKYKQARQLFAGLNSFPGYFGEGTACYRLQDYDCARQAFAAAAWLSDDEALRAKAVFNLANSYFFAENYDQAAVLYRDAGLLGIDPAIIRTNLGYAESMQASLQKELKQLQKKFRKEQWKAAVNGDKVPSLNDFLSNDENLLTGDAAETQDSLYQIPLETIKNEFRLRQGLVALSGSFSSGRWIETDRVLPSTTAQMLNRLFEMELGIAASLKQPRRVEGKRQW